MEKELYYTNNKLIFLLFKDRFGRLYGYATKNLIRKTFMIVVGFKQISKILCLILSYEIDTLLRLLPV